MGMGDIHFKGRAKVKGKPKDFARAEKDMMKFKQRRRFFIGLDILVFLSIITSIYFFFLGDTRNGAFSLLPAALILLYFLPRKLSGGYWKTLIQLLWNLGLGILIAGIVVAAQSSWTDISIFIAGLVLCIITALFGPRL